MWWSALTGRLERARGLDPAVEKVTAAVGAVLRPGPVKDALHGRWLGHPVHPLLITMPIGMFGGAGVLDLTGASPAAARRLVAAGLLSVPPTAAAGLADWSALGAFHRPRRVGLVHAGANVVASALYAGSYLARRRGEHRRGKLLGLAGMSALGVGGYLGGHLSYSEGVGVNRNADRRPEPAEWTDAAAAADVREGALVRADVEGQPVLLTRRGDRVLAIGAVCSHYGGPLEQGGLHGTTVHCPWHGSHFDLTDGSVCRGPATSPQPAFETRTVGDRIEVRARRSRTTAAAVSP